MQLLIVQSQVKVFRYSVMGITQVSNHGKYVSK